jgi:hypothetical protein
MRLRAQLLVLGAVAALVAPIAADGRAGRAAGKVGLITTSEKAYGYSSPDASWMSVTLDGAPLSSLTSSWLGYVRTARSIYAYNATNNHWYTSTYRGFPLGEAANLSTAVLWTTTGCYGISNLWTFWKYQPFLGMMETTRGGGSAGTFSLVWTSRAAYAYNPATAQWFSRALEAAPQGGIVLDGLGLVWWANGAVAYSPSTGTFVPVTIPDASGLSASGAGEVGLIWSDNQAQAYSSRSGGWSSVDTNEAIEGGNAAGEVALVWTTDRAYAFSVSTGTWSYVQIQGTSEKSESFDRPDPSSFHVAPNPAPAGDVSIQIPDAGNWRIGVFDLSGQRIREFAVEVEGPGSTLVWDGRNEEGRAVSAGSYWVRAESDHRAEARRIVILRQ